MKHLMIVGFLFCGLTAVAGPGDVGSVGNSKVCVGGLETQQGTEFSYCQGDKVYFYHPKGHGFDGDVSGPYKLKVLESNLKGWISEAGSERLQEVLPSLELGVAKGCSLRKRDICVGDMVVANDSVYPLKVIGIFENGDFVVKDNEGRLLSRKHEKTVKINR